MMENIKQLLQELGEGAQLTISVRKYENNAGNHLQFHAVIYEAIGRDRFEVIHWSEDFHDFDALIKMMNEQAAEWLGENS